MTPACGGRGWVGSFSFCEEVRRGREKGGGVREDKEERVRDREREREGERER
jgi:hypothetical protein